MRRVGIVTDSTADVPADLADESGRHQAIEAIHGLYGPPDVLVNNAGFG